MARDFGVPLFDSIDAMLENVDAVLLESNDGRRHLAEVRPVLAAGKPVFIDKPLAASYADAAAIAALARENECPFFSSSSLRFDANITGLRGEEAGEVLGCDAYTAAVLEETNPGLYWYGIHGVEILYSFMGTGCKAVQCYRTDTLHHVTGIWADGRLATVRGSREGAHDFGATVVFESGIKHTLFSREIPIYAQLLRQIVPFFQGGPAPVPVQETLEIMAFIEAAIISEREGRAVEISEVK